MRVRKYWRELYLSGMMFVAYAIIIASMIALRDLTSLAVTAAGVFVAVLGVGLYDQWHDAELAKARVRTRR